MYKIEFAHIVFKELENIYRIDRRLYDRVICAITFLSSSPYTGKRLKGKFTGDYSLRVGEYRIIYNMSKQKLVVYVVDVGHRRDIYR